jgi:small-conductance mechanosensitive channel
LVIGFFVLRWVLHKAINKFARRTGNGAVAGVLAKSKRGQEFVETLQSERRTQRAETIASLLSSTVTIILVAVLVVMVLAELGFNIVPVVASASIIGVALGFGAQTLVKDFLTGFFMLAEDQYGVGDIVDLGPATGTVEGVSLRTTRIRDVQGVLWHIPNGQVNRVGNKSQLWARALIDVSVGYEADLRRAEQVIQEVAQSLYDDSGWHDLLLEPPEVWGVEELGTDGVKIRLVVKTKPNEQFKVMRELRIRLKERFDQESDLGMAYPARTMLLHDTSKDGGGAGLTRP